jgi:hypothetical protein
LRDHHETCKQILVDTPKILHAKNEEATVENKKKMARSDVLVKMGERKNVKVQATLKTITCALFTCHIWNMREVLV